MLGSVFHPEQHVISFIAITSIGVDHSKNLKRAKYNVGGGEKPQTFGVGPQTQPGPGAIRASSSIHRRQQPNHPEDTATTPVIVLLATQSLDNHRPGRKRL